MLVTITSLPTSPIIYYNFYETPFGTCLIGCIDTILCYIAFIDSNECSAIAALQRCWPTKIMMQNSAATEALHNQLFGSIATRALPLTIALCGSAFQMHVWQELLTIPSGSTTHYEDIAKRIGKPNAVRAVANAIGANNIAWVVPCHRVIRKSGELGGFRWGIACKKRMLAYEATL